MIVSRFLLETGKIVEEKDKNMITLIFDLCYASNQYFNYVFAYVMKITYTLYMTANIQSNSPTTYYRKLAKIKKSANKKWCFFLVTKTSTFVLMSILYLYFLFRPNKQNIGFRYFNISSAPSISQPLIMVVHSNRKHPLCTGLTNHIFIEYILDI